MNNKKKNTPMSRYIAKPPKAVGEVRKQPCPNCPKQSNGKRPWTWQTYKYSGWPFGYYYWHCKECNKTYSAE